MICRHDFGRTASTLLHLLHRQLAPNCLSSAGQQALYDGNTVVWRFDEHGVPCYQNVLHVLLPDRIPVIVYDKLLQLLRLYELGNKRMEQVAQEEDAASQRRLGQQALDYLQPSHPSCHEHPTSSSSWYCFPGPTSFPPVAFDVSRSQGVQTSLYVPAKNEQRNKRTYFLPFLCQASVLFLLGQSPYRTYAHVYGVRN
jgi:hypothetical protein